MSLSVRRSTTIILSILLARCTPAQKCYYPDQTVEPTHIPCNASAQISHCCQFGASCLTTGLCFMQWDTSFNTGTCTDKSWTAPICFQRCPQFGVAGHGFETLYRCNYNQWCCSTGGNFTSCCDDGGVALFDLNEKNTSQIMGGTGFVDGYTISAVDLSQTSTSTAASGATLAPVAVPTTPAEGLSDNTTDAKTATNVAEHDGKKITMVGLGAGLGVGLPLFTGTMVALFFLRRLRGQSKGQRKQTEEQSASVVNDGSGMAHTMQEVQFHEVEALPAEMPNSRRDFTQEM